jgi:DNA-binding MarR family transcriptional regulator
MARTGQPSPGTAHAPARLTYLVKQVELAVRGEINRAVRRFDLTALQYTALSVLARHAGLSSAQLARRSFVTPQAANEIVALLEQRGLIERAEDPQNRRILRTSLTPLGEKVLRACDEEVDAIESRMTSALSPAEAEGVRAALSSMLHELVPGHRP